MIDLPRSVDPRQPAALRLIASTISAALWLLSQPALAQRPAPAQDRADQPASQPTLTGDPKRSSEGEKLEQLQQQLHRLQDQSAAALARQRQELDLMRRRLEQLEQADQQHELRQIQESRAFEAGIRFYGFLDFFVGKHFFADDQLALLYMPNSLSFALTGFNLYADALVTPTLGALMEIRFTFQPLGSPTDFDHFLRQGDELIPLPDSSFERSALVTYDPTDSEQFSVHGLVLERAHITYTPVDWLNVIAGRFITPFGIWNVDHGSPVVIGTRLPHLLLRKIIPLAQTGLQIYGRFFPVDELSLDYALTVSNGRGPMEQVFDLDDNKGFGLRLRATFETDGFKIAAGTYGYSGGLHDYRLGVVWNPATSEVTARPEIVEDYDELGIAADLLVELLGLRLQAEFASRRVVFNTPKLMDDVDRVLQLGNPVVSRPVYKANFIGLGGYVLLAYQLPLTRWLGRVSVMPYAIWEYCDHDKTQRATKVERAVSAGLNIRPLPALVLKVEYYNVKSMMVHLHSAALQAALSF